MLSVEKIIHFFKISFRFGGQYVFKVCPYDSLIFYFLILVCLFCFPVLFIKGGKKFMQFGGWRIGEEYLG